jgi:hypothetical protein
MQEIVAVKRKATGIEVQWEEKGKKNHETFSFSDLIDMKINALDLLDHPHLYKIDQKQHKIFATEGGCCTYT